MLRIDLLYQQNHRIHPYHAGRGARHASAHARAAETPRPALSKRLRGDIEERDIESLSISKGVSVEPRRGAGAGASGARSPESHAFASTWANLIYSRGFPV